MNSHSLTHELSSHLVFRERLREAFPDVDDECLQDTLEGLTNLSEMLAEVLRSLLADEDFVGALKKRIGEMQARSTRLAERARKKRELVSQVMAEAEIKRLVEADFTVSLRASRAPLVVVDEELIPEAFWRPQAPKLDRQALTAVLSAGQGVEGAILGNPPMTITVRTK
jgi:hypothetical protein